MKNAENCKPPTFLWQACFFVFYWQFFSSHLTADLKGFFKLVPVVKLGPLCVLTRAVILPVTQVFCVFCRSFAALAIGHQAQDDRHFSIGKQ
ncbi:hypothetical protein [uncultured Bartonella sp.]|uniref:hypothetical protein n=1 Tax=uncultured Bartonella sp. TaxID=104108 RepID=UPI00260F6FB6|nr:hypothetical protein [uncultured Bartonella sp.]